MDLNNESELDNQATSTVINDYGDKTTEELINQLIVDEDRVTLEHILELASRPDAIDPLIQILRNEQYWKEGKAGEWWILLHAFVILSASRNPRAVEELVQSLTTIFFEDHDWIIDLAHDALAYFGESAVDPLIAYIDKSRFQIDVNSDFIYAASTAAKALTRIGIENPGQREKILDFLCSVLTDPRETDPTFLGFIIDYPLSLDRERGIAAARDAYERGVVDETIHGDFEEMLAYFDKQLREGGSEFTGDLFEFYRPEEIAARQKRRKQDEEDREKLLLRKNAQEVMKTFEPPPPPSVPKGYSMSNSGVVTGRHKPGRNDNCPCGSGKKYKKCHGK